MVLVCCPSSAFSFHKCTLNGFKDLQQIKIQHETLTIGNSSLKVKLKMWRLCPSCGEVIMTLFDNRVA